MMNMRTDEAGVGAEAGAWLHFAASATLLAMAVVTAIANADPVHLLCRAMGHGWLSLDGMTSMYLLMAVFHASPWWKWTVLQSRRHKRRRRASAADPAAMESN